METDSNQTKFSYEKPFFEDPSSVSQEPNTDGEAEPSNKIVAWVRAHVLISALIVTGLVMLLIIAVAMMLMPSRNDGTTPLDIFTAESSPVPLSPLEQKISDVKTELNEADPIRGMEPFPPVDLDIRLDETQR